MLPSALGFTILLLLPASDSSCERRLDASTSALRLSNPNSENSPAQRSSLQLVPNRLLDVFQAHGHNELDTARSYTGGTSEEFLGQVSPCSLNSDPSLRPTLELKGFRK